MKIMKIQITDSKRKVVKLYVNGYTFKDIGIKLNVSSVRVHDMWHQMVEYCTRINGWKDDINKLKKKDFLEKYGKAMLKILECHKI